MVPHTLLKPGINLVPQTMVAPEEETLPRWMGFRSRPRVAGKFLEVAGRKCYVKGVTYGTFRPDADGTQFPDRATVDRDFAAMVANGINSVRIYTEPPRWLLDAAWRAGLRVMVGLPWEQH